ncbi:MAG: hypothetical protein ACI4Q3_00400 [Kiritimatiellia bacterium]
MPNKRKQGKKLVAGWLQSGDAEEFKDRAAELGMTTTDLLTLLIREELKRSNRTNTNPTERNA